MLTDIAAADPREVLRAEVCVVGGGAAGITVATELARNGISVIVLEGGGRRFEERSQELFRSEVVGLAHSGIRTLRFRTLGGATTRWAGQALPLQDIDFTARSWVPDSGWPLTPAELQPYLKRAEAILAIQTFGDPGEPRWPSVLPAGPAFDERLLSTVYSQFSPSPNFAEVSRDALETLSKINVVLHANVTGIVASPQGDAVDCVTARDIDGHELTVGAEHFVVCCGGIETARVLLLSTNRSESGIGNDHDLIGRYFQDHPGFSVGEITGEAAREHFRPRKEGGIKYLPLIRAAEQWQAKTESLNCGASVVFEGARLPGVEAGKSLVTALRERRFGRGRLEELREIARHPLQLATAANRYYVRGVPSQDTSGPMSLAIGLEQAPNPDSRVTLGERVDALGQRVARLDWRLGEAEIETARRFVKVVCGEMERLGLASVDDGAFSLSDDPGELSGVVVDIGHHMGTTRMATDPAHGVVDSNCTVHGVQNLHVASCSVFPTSGVSNPTFTMLALSVRLADHLARALTAPG